MQKQYCTYSEADECKNSVETDECRSSIETDGCKNGIVHTLKPTKCTSSRQTNP